MLRYVATRVLQALLVVLVVSFLVFAMVRVIPGDPAQTLAGPDASAQSVAAIRADLGLDEPIIGQYLEWLGSAVRGDLGSSYYFQRPVAELLGSAFPVTLRLGLVAMFVAILLGLLLGTLSSAARRPIARKVAATFTTFAYAVPNFVLGIVMIAIFAVSLGWLPPGGWSPLGADPGLSLQLMVLPVLALALPLAGVIARFQHAAMDETLREDYMLTSLARGTSRFRLLAVDAQRNAAIPVLTILGIQLGQVLGGAVVVETVFSIPGLGRALLQAVLNRDYPTVQGVLILLSLVFVTVNLLVDLLYGVLDPRVRVAATR